MTQIVLFDAKIKTRRGVIPYYEQTYTEGKTDGDLVWFHESYGRMRLYKLEYVDDDTFIAVDMRRCTWAGSDDYTRWSKNPSAAIKEGVDIPAPICFV